MRTGARRAKPLGSDVALGSASRWKDSEAYRAAIEAELINSIPDVELREAFRQACPPELQLGGLARYWRRATRP